MKLLDSVKSWSGMWMSFGQDRYKHDDNFMNVSNYAINNDIRVNNSKENVQLMKKQNFMSIFSFFFLLVNV